jgi:hypothetical protein
MSLLPGTRPPASRHKRREDAHAAGPPATTTPASETEATRSPSGGSPKASPPRKRKLARVRELVKRINDSTPTKLLGFVLLLASAVTLGVSGYDKFFAGFSCRSEPATYSGVPSASPTLTHQQVNAVLAAYAASYSRHDKNGLKDLMTPHACRYPAKGQGPETRSAALTEYQRQFDMQAQDRKHPHPTVNYALTQPDVTMGAGGANEAAVTSHFAVTAGKGGKDKLGAGKVGLHIVKKGDQVLIDQIVVR